MTVPENPSSSRDTTADKPSAFAGISAVIAKHPRAWLAGAIALVFVLLASGSIALGAATGTKPAPEAEAPAAPADTDAGVDPTARTVPSEVADPNRLRTCSIADLADDDLLGDLYGYVVNTDSGDVLFNSDGGDTEAPADVLKVLTASAAIFSLGPDYTMSTKVYRGSAEGTVVLVGGGDSTLSAVPAGQESIYPGAPKLSDLAAQVRASVGDDYPITEIILDSSYWSSDDAWNEEWGQSPRKDGYLSPVTALQVDGDREDATQLVSKRSEDPVTNAGEAFAEALGAPDATLTLGTVEEGSQQIAEVKSQPLSALVGTMLQYNDSTLAEQIARVTSKVMGLDGSAASLDQVIPAALDELGLETAGDVTIDDGSGLSANNRVSPRFVTQLMTKLAEGQDNLNFVYNSLAVGGQAGELSDRFSGNNAVAGSAVTAKAGAIRSDYTLAGLVSAEDGSTLSFAFFEIGDDVKKEAKGALDNLTAAVYACGDNLSNN